MPARSSRVMPTMRKSPTSGWVVTRAWKTAPSGWARMSPSVAAAKTSGTQPGQRAPDDEVGAALGMDGHLPPAGLQPLQPLLGSRQHPLSGYLAIDVEAPQRGAPHQPEATIALAEDVYSRVLQRVVAAHAGGKT